MDSFAAVKSSNLFYYFAPKVLQMKLLTLVVGTDPQTTTNLHFTALL
jgi:hypothetical protein